MIFEPWIVVPAPILLYIMFKFTYKVLLKTFNEKPKKSSNANDTGYFIMIFLNITFLFVVGGIISFLSVPIPHD